MAKGLEFRYAPRHRSPHPRSERPQVDAIVFDHAGKSFVVETKALSPSSNAFLLAYGAGTIVGGLLPRSPARASWIVDANALARDFHSTGWDLWTAVKSCSDRLAEADVHPAQQRLFDADRIKRSA